MGDLDIDEQGFLDRYGARLRPKNEFWLWRLFGRFSDAWLTRWWTTFWVPGDSVPTIWYPTSMTFREALAHQGTIEHELIHCEQQSTLLGWALTVLAQVFPLPVLFSGRWFVERPAYLYDIEQKRRTIDESVEILWHAYGWAWPRPLMRRWFERELSRRSSPHTDR